MDTQTKESQNSKQVFNTIINLLGQKAEISDKYTGKHIVLNVTTEEPGRLIGRKGIALNSITHLMNLMLKRESPEHPHVIIDVHGIGEDKRERPPRKERSERKPNNRKPNNRKPNNRDGEQANNDAPQAKKDAPKNDAPKAAEAKKDAPKNDAPKAPEAKKEAPKNDAPKAAEAKKEAPKADAPKAPEATKEAPKNDAPKAAEAKKEAPKADAPKAPEAKKEAPKKQEPKLSRLQLECRNAAKEVKKWGDATYLPAMAEAECFKALDNFKNDKEIVATIDESRSNGDKKRVKLALKA